MRDGRPDPWTSEQMEAAFLTVNRTVSIKTIENWRAGRVLPSPRNIILLAEIFSGNDLNRRGAWLSRLTESVNLSKANLKTIEPAVVTEEEADTHSAPTPPQQKSSRLLLGMGLGAILTAGLVGMTSGKVQSFQSFLKTDPPTVTDIRFCTEANFDREIKRCRLHEPRFPAGTKLIHVSFETQNVPYGQPFSRRWYRDGQLFIERDGFFDEAWENWTWIREGEDGDHLPGNYVLRIIIDGQVTTGTFRID